MLVFCYRIRNERLACFSGKSLRFELMSGLKNLFGLHGLIISKSEIERQCRVDIHKDGQKLLGQSCPSKFFVFICLKGQPRRALNFNDFGFAI